MTVEPSTVDAQLALAAQTVRGVDRDAPVLLVCHVNPDGDALGSMLGVRARVAAARVHARAGDVPGALPPGRAVPVPARPANCWWSRREAMPKPELAVSFDAASPSRLGELLPALEAAPAWLMVDHHASNPGFGTVALLDPAAAATALVVARLLDRLGVQIDTELATCLYVGLVTDTGSFKYDTTTPEVLALAARLVAAGVRPAAVARAGLRHPAVRRPAAPGRRARPVRAGPGGGRRAGPGVGLRHARPSSSSTVSRPTCWRASWTSSGPRPRRTSPAWSSRPVRTGGRCRCAVAAATDVSAVAVALGGGGHRLAAGFTAVGSVESILAGVRSQLVPKANGR